MGKADKKTQVKDAEEEMSSYDAVMKARASLKEMTGASPPKESEDEPMTPAAKATPTKKAAAADPDEVSTDDTDGQAPKAKAKAKAKAAAKPADDDEDSSDDEPAPKAKAKAKAKAAVKPADDEGSSDDDDEQPPPKAKAKAKAKAAAKPVDDDGDMSDEESAPKVAKPKGNDEKPSEEKTVFVGGLPFSTTEEQLKKDFSECGKILKLNMPKNDEGKSKGIAFITFETDEGLTAALKYDGDDYGGRTLKVNKALTMERSTLVGALRLR